MKVLLVGLGGFLGSITRFGISQAARSLFITSFPLGTLAVNALGCFLLGFFGELFHKIPFKEGLFGLPNGGPLFISVGFIGAFTTFSAFSFETLELFQDKNIFWACFNVFLNLVLGLSGLFLGKFLASQGA